MVRAGAPSTSLFFQEKAWLGRRVTYAHNKGVLRNFEHFQKADISDGG